MNVLKKKFIKICVVLMAFSSQINFTMTKEIVTISGKDFDLIHSKTRNNVVDSAPLLYLTTVPKELLQGLFWISHTIRAFDPTVVTTDGVGSINFGYYSHPKKISTLVKKINQKQYHYDCDGHIYEFFVEEPYRKSGIGSHLFSKAIQTMTALGCKKITWRSYPYGSSKPIEQEQGPLNAFYTKRGGRLLSETETNEPGEYIFVYTPNQQTK